MTQEDWQKIAILLDAGYQKAVKAQDYGLSLTLGPMVEIAVDFALDDGFVDVDAEFAELEKRYS